MIKKEMIVGLLFPGDMGLAVAEVMLKNNFRVITAGEGRSQNTADRIKKSEIEDLVSLQKVVDASDIILSVNSPDKR